MLVIFLGEDDMSQRNWRQIKGKIHDAKMKQRHSDSSRGSPDEMRSARNDEKRLKRKKKRLSLDWFFRPEGD